jgi:hypothetical protein
VAVEPVADDVAAAVGGGERDDVSDRIGTDAEE